MTKYISEIASSHTGNPKLIEKISQLHCESNADYLKYQIFKTENLFSKKNKKFSNFKKIEVGFKKWENLINKFSVKTKIILEPFDEESYKFCKKFKNKTLIKISSSEADNFNLIIDAVKNFKKVFLNISGLSQRDIEKITLALKKKSIRKKIVLMYGFQSYPTVVNDLRLNLFSYFKKKGFEFGYADHTEFGISKKLIDICSKIKNSFKCKYIEKHVCYNLKKKPNDYITSINMKDMDEFIEKINKKRKVRLNFKFRKDISYKEKKYFLSFSKFGFLKNNLQKGSIVSEDDLTFFRSSSKKKGITRLNIFGNKLILKKSLKKGNQLFPNFVSF